jgi:CHAD domain-containing protein
MSSLADRLTREVLLLASGQLEQVTAAPQVALTPRQVHQCRVAVKRLRAAWALLAPAVPAAAAEAIARLRALNAAAAPARTAAVAVETLDDLLRRARRPRRRDALAALRAALPAPPPPPERAYVGDTWRIEAAAWRALPVQPDDAALRAGVAATCARAARRLHRAQRAGSADAWHRARTQVKRLLSQLELLCPQPAATFGHRPALLRDLADTLGRMQDLADLRALADDAPLRRGERATIDRHLRRRLRRLARRAGALASAVFDATALPADVEAWRRDGGIATPAGTPEKAAAAA